MTTLTRSSTAPPEETPTDDLFTVHEVALKLRVDDTTVRRWIKNGSLSAVTLPHKGQRAAYRVKRSVYEQLVT